jgi:UDP-2,3-diacylglucosamine pyrophosphatase LpxH
MAQKKSRLNIPTLVAGAVIGGCIVWLRTLRVGKHPEKTAVQKSINRALSKTLRQARREGKIPLDAGRRCVIFSDHHKGVRNQADDFQPCERTYLAALDYYLVNDYTLVILGDAEEAWEEEVVHVMGAYSNVFESEARFHPDRYIRVHGNHDDVWQSDELVQQHLHPLFPNIRFKDGLVFEFVDKDGAAGDIFVVHGHQGTIDSDWLAFAGRTFLPLYRELQNATGLGRTSPARDACLRAEHDSQMYRWAAKQKKLIFVAGHTHRPVWSSRTHLEKLTGQLYSLRQDRPDDYQEQATELKRKIKEREEKYPPCTDTVKTKPCYFNTGCCRFADGDITGIELDAEQIRLVKWGEKDGEIEPVTLEETELSEVFFYL